MALTPRKEEVNALKKASYDAERAKRKRQEAQGKEFVNNGQGVIPEAVWKALPGKTEQSNG